MGGKLASFQRGYALLGYSGRTKRWERLRAGKCRRFANHARFFSPNGVTDDSPANARDFMPG